MINRISAGQTKQHQESMAYMQTQRRVAFVQVSKLCVRYDYSDTLYDVISSIHLYVLQEKGGGWATTRQGSNALTQFSDSTFQEYT